MVLVLEVRTEVGDLSGWRNRWLLVRNEAEYRSRQCRKTWLLLVFLLDVAQTLLHKLFALC